MVPNSPYNISKPNWKESEKDLVAEQPGLGLSFIGLFLALFAGLAIRAVISPDKVRTQLEKATAKIHQDFQVSFKQAYVSFSDGIWPDLSVVVKDVTIESTRTCFLTPMAEINEIRLPLSWWHLFKGKIYIHEVLADEVNLSLRSEYKSCGNRETASSVQPTSGVQPPSPFSRNAENGFENVSRKNPIDIVQFRTLKVHYLPIAFTSFEIQKLMIKLKSEEPRVVEATGQLNLGGDTIVGDYSSHADLQIDVIEGDHPSVTAAAKGIWREGHYSVHLSTDLKNQQFDFHTTAHHLPLSQIIPVFKKYRLMESDFNGKKAWISGDVKMKGLLSESRKTPIQFEGLKLEGDLGEIACAQAEVESLEPLKVKPVDLSIKGLNLKELLVFLNRPHPSPALGALGIFTGNAHFISPENVVLRGDYSGLEFIFANRGSRKTQVLSLVSGELSLIKNQWRISVDRIRPAGGIFEGKVQISADKDFRDLNVDAKIEELSLSPDVQLLMTNGGSLGALTGDLKAHLVKADIQDLRGHLRWDQLLIDGFHLTKPRVQLQTKGTETWVDFSANDLEFSVQNPTVASLFAPLIQELGLKQNERVLLKSPRGQIRTEKLKQLVWTDFQAQTSYGIFQSRGGWNEKADLVGEFKVSGHQKGIWTIGGSRNAPTLGKKESVR